MSRRIVIAGGTGFIGTSLSQALIARGDEVVVLGRRAPAAHPARCVVWDARSLGDWVAELDGADGIVNLVGRSVDCRKTPDHCDEILRSRVESTRVIGQACAQLTQVPAVWVQMSTAHIYGDPPELICDEDAAFGYGLAPDVGRAWEAAFAEVCPAATRAVILRTSFVLGRDGGALQTLRRLARFGLGGTVGHGRQGLSWIHETDMNQLILAALDDDQYTGAYIASAPEPVSNRDFMRMLRRAIGMPIGLPAPAFMVRLAAATLLRTDPELALYGRYVVSRRLAEAGFSFAFPQLDAALADLCGKRVSKGVTDSSETNP